MEKSKPSNLISEMSHWLSVSILFIIGELVYRYGVVSSLVVVLALFLAFLSSLLFPRKNGVEKKENNNEGNRLEKLLVYLWVFEFYVLTVVSGIIIFRIAFRLNLVVPIYLSAIILVIIYLLVVKRSLFFRNTNFLIISTLAVVLPIYIYLQKGLESVYHKLLYYHPRLLHYEVKSLWLIFIVSFIIFLIKYLIADIANETTNNESKKMSKNLVAILLVTTFTLAFGTINTVAITENVLVDRIEELPILLVKKFSSSMFFTIVLGLLITSITITVVKTPVLFLKSANNSEWLSLIIKIVVAGIIVLLPFNISILNVYVSSGILLTILFIMNRITKLFKENVVRSQ